MIRPGVNMTKFDRIAFVNFIVNLAKPIHKFLSDSKLHLVKYIAACCAFVVERVSLSKI